MNAQEKKIYALAGEKDEVIVLQPRKDQSFAKLVLSDFVNMPFTSKAALRARVRKNAYFLIRNDEKAVLYSVDDNLYYDSYDVTEEVKASEDPYSFVFMGFKFKYHEILG
ncbi:hypothetical protein [Lacicoccus alkaliphilus]|uniref:Uncharacterized protein n=1 Tax=Lacicoccus alkaliphilus DSM 16010 TaxID=1123231 RepID=A0A1M7IWS6_9BACL|nr:hypothetical protein [Salinicoccus alkaliphilus]SHM45186.1 hypothetical protein SAMN02745189_02184 [Salinicoccus alkaliphilus DSM 16010]